MASKEAMNAAKKVDEYYTDNYSANGYVPELAPLLMARIIDVAADAKYARLVELLAPIERGEYSSDDIEAIQRELARLKGESA